MNSELTICVIVLQVFLKLWTRRLHQCTLKGHAEVIIVYVTQTKTSPSEWNNQQEEGGKGYVGVPRIQPSSTIGDLYFKHNV